MDSVLASLVAAGIGLIGVVLGAVLTEVLAGRRAASSERRLFDREKRERVRVQTIEAIDQTKSQLHAWMQDVLEVTAGLPRSQPRYGGEVYPRAQFFLVGDADPMEAFLRCLMKLMTEPPATAIKQSDLQAMAEALFAIDRALEQQRDRVNRDELPVASPPESASRLGLIFQKYEASIRSPDILQRPDVDRNRLG